ncbi:MAG: hypothetical protein U9R15_15940 [Chloroflexota bacterium]|nr:hypothetical protein [Chloroflexota bacterium]
MLIEMVGTGKRLLATLESKDFQAIQEAAKSFSQAVDDAWQAYQQGEIPTQMRGQAFPRMMYQFATVELPAAVADPQRWPAIAREVRNFINMIDIVATRSGE